MVLSTLTLLCTTMASLPRTMPSSLAKALVYELLALPLLCRLLTCGNCDQLLSLERPVLGMEVSSYYYNHYYNDDDDDDDDCYYYFIFLKF